MIGFSWFKLTGAPPLLSWVVRWQRRHRRSQLARFDRIHPVGPESQVVVGGDLTADAMTLVDLEGPKAYANPDPLLGPNQVRYQAQFVNEFTGEVIDVSVNYDPTTGQFGTIKPASGK